ncbi:hypothetical protein FHW36_1189 [Chitinophaga polysaccharea]|uniref:Uncharacterized protein n=1 Tax=Chitinophaga polysaccharea TaxID=1293035 RepID=A0A561P0X3_9BACT|nr:hypothetical protein FHW36_1189 [Chitinophaga polysaccharea]
MKKENLHILFIFRMQQIAIIKKANTMANAVLIFWVYLVSFGNRQYKVGDSTIKLYTNIYNIIEVPKFIIR